MIFYKKDYVLKTTINKETLKARYYLDSRRISRETYENIVADYIIFPKRYNFLTYQNKKYRIDKNTIERG